MSEEQGLNRNLGIERVFSLGDYKSIRFSDNINNLPNDVLFNSDFINKVRYLQLLNVELNFRQYIKLSKLLEKFSPAELDEAMSLLEEEKATTLKDIQNILIHKE